MPQIDPETRCPIRIKNRLRRMRRDGESLKQTAARIRKDKTLKIGGVFAHLLIDDWLAAKRRHR